MLQSEYDAIVRHKRLKIAIVILGILLIGIFLAWLYMDGKKIKPAFKDEAAKKAYEQAQFENSFQEPEEPEVQTYTEDELRVQKPEIYNIIQPLTTPTSDITTLKQ